jgi:tetratricopeptide (TPR) repeat protein
LLFQLANIANIEGDYAAAETLYRQCLGTKWENAAACNELSLLLAVRNKDVSEALKLVNRAMEIAGPLPTLLDTRATAWIAKADYEQAILDLNNALSDGASSVMNFHLALAYDGLGDENSARAALQAATNQGLDVQNLPVPERIQYLELQTKFGKLPNR